MFTFKGKNSVDMGVFAKEENFLGKAQVKYESIEIDGKDGEETIPLNFQNFIGTLEGVVLMKDNRDEVLSWLSGKGELEYLGKKTTLQFLDGYEVKKHKKPFGVTFIRDPFWYKLVDEYETVTTTVTNEGNTPSQPIIKLIKTTSNVVEISISGSRFEYDFKGEPEVVIDCQEMSATYNGLLRNRQLKIGFDFPKLLPKKTSVAKLKGNPTIQIKRKDVWL